MPAEVNIGRHKTGAALVRYALEQLPVRHTFGIPGVHNTEIYDELGKSERIQPVLVTHEAGAAFMADGLSRTSGEEIGCVVIVPAAGMAYAMAGIGEAFLDGIPMLVISGGIRSDLGLGYQLHDLDQIEIIRGITKGAWRVEHHGAIVPTIFEAYRTAISGVPGPTFVEIPVDIQLFTGEIEAVPVFETPDQQFPDVDSLIDQAADILTKSVRPGIFVGWGAVAVASEIAAIAELLGAPVATTLQGVSAFRGDHPLHAGMGFSEAAVPAATNAFRDIDTLLAVGTRFGEIPTGSYGCRIPEQLIHIDIDPAVIGRNYPAAVGIVSDAAVAVPQLLAVLKARQLDCTDRKRLVEQQLAADKASYREEWLNHRSARVNPAVFFDELRRQLEDEAIVTVDDGNHTFLAAELFEVRGPRQFVSPTDFNCMGYGVPAAIGSKLVNPSRQVVSIVGDGAFLMTGLELLTAVTLRAGIAVFVFADGELSQISQGQEIPYNRKTCTVLPDYRIEGIAAATGADFVLIENDERVRAGIETALAAAALDRPVVVDVRIDYSKRTRFTEGVVKSVWNRFPLSDRVRIMGRAAWRRMVPGQKKSS